MRTHVRSTLALVPAAIACLAPLAAAADELDENASRLAGQEYGKCVAEGRLLKPRAISFVLSGEREEGLKLAHGNCLVKALHRQLHGDITGKWPVSTFRILLADGLVRTDFAASGPGDFSAVPPLAHGSAFLTGSTPGTVGDVQLSVSVGQLGECVARREPEAVRQLAQTIVGTPEELAALRALVPTFGACLQPGAAINFPRTMLRDNAVLAYARLAYSLAAMNSAAAPAAEEVH